MSGTVNRAPRRIVRLLSYVGFFLTITRRAIFVQVHPIRLDEEIAAQYQDQCLGRGKRKRSAPEKFDPMPISAKSNKGGHGKGGGMEDEQLEERDERNGVQSSPPHRGQEKIKHEGSGMVAVGDAGGGRGEVEGWHLDCSPDDP